LLTKFPQKKFIFQVALLIVLSNLLKYQKKYKEKNLENLKEKKLKNLKNQLKKEKVVI